MKRWLSACLLSALAIGVFPSLASAGTSPPNDLIENATKISALPFTDTLDTSGAHGDGPRACGNSGSVFYKFRPSVETRVQADTFGSDYDTVLAVLQGPRRNLDVVKCDDDTFSAQSLVHFRAEAGRRYFFEVSTCCGSGRTGGGNLVFTVQQRPLGELTVDFAFTGGTIDTVSGDVTLEGTLDCSHPAEIELFGSLRQRRSDLFIARASFDEEIHCVGGSTPVSLEVIPESTVSFVAGDAKLTFTMFAFDGENSLQEDASEVVALTES
jgi:hypothetical protein